MHGYFSPDTFDFLWGIRMNNNREWFLAHKQQYVDYLYEPMKALGKDLFAGLGDKPGTVCKVSRIYRDARMHHPDPYKESLWICIRQDVDWWAENPCLFFDLHPEGAEFGFYLGRPRVSVLEEFRKEIADNPEPFLARMEQVERDTGIPVTARCYKRPKAAADPRLAPYFAWKSDIGCTRTLEPGAELFSPQLGENVGSFFRQLTPLYDFFTRYRV